MGASLEQTLHINLPWFASSGWHHLKARVADYPCHHLYITIAKYNEMFSYAHPFAHYCARNVLPAHPYTLR